jgi:hypothetical protein
MLPPGKGRIVLETSVKKELFRKNTYDIEQISDIVYWSPIYNAVTACHS